MAQKFEHEPLEDQDSMRLLEILPGKSTDPIRCSCVHTIVADVNQKPFEAVSYTWGDPTKSHPITINGRQFLINKNAHDVLRRMRCKKRGRRRWKKSVRSVWIDAICINQDDAEEKNHQLPLMKGIYSSATQVYAWLGEASADSDRALNFIRKLRVLYRWCTRELGNPVPPYPPGLWAIPVTVRYILRLICTPGWRALREFLKRPWFRRIWVYQEVVAAKRIQLVCGSKSVNFQNFAPVVHWLMYCEAAEIILQSTFLTPVSNLVFLPKFLKLRRRRAYNETVLAKFMQMIWGPGSDEDFAPITRWLMFREATTILHYGVNPEEHGAIGSMHLSRMHETRYNAKQKNQYTRLEDHLCETVNWEATDPRDMIYAVLGIVAEGNDPKLKPDYKTSVVDVFVTATKYIIITGGSLRILCCTGVGQQRQISDLPTWVPDFTGVKSRSAIGMMGEKLLYVTNLPQMSVCFHGNKMRVRGTRVGVVGCMGRINDQVEFKGGNERSREVLRWLEDSQAALNPVPESLLTALIQNYFERTGISFHADFKSWKRVMEFRFCERFSWRFPKSVYNLFTLRPEELGKGLLYLKYMIVKTLYMRVANVSTNGLAIVPRQTEIGDVVCILFGLSVPMILRENAPRGDGQQSFSVVGGCYVDGLDSVLPEELVEEDFILT